MMKFAQALRRMRKEEKGFTLIELMVVVVIIGVLAAVAVPKITGIVYQSKVNADIATGKTLQDAVDRYQQNNNQPPAALGDLITGTGGPYIAAVPKAQQDSLVVSDGGSGTSQAVIYTYDNTVTPIKGEVKVYNLQSATPATPVWP